jgi:hypothetical protein
MTQDALGLAVVIVDACVTPRSHLGADAKMARQSLQIALLDLDAWIAAAIAGALGAVVLNLGGCTHALNRQEKVDEQRV